MNALSLHLNGESRELDGAADGAPARRAARRARPHRHQGGLRRGRVRRLHGADGRRAGALLPGAARSSATAGGSRRSRASPRTGARASWSGSSPRAASSAAPARRGSSSPPGRSCERTRIADRERRRRRPWPATSAAAPATRASCARSAGETDRRDRRSRPRSLDAAVRRSPTIPAFVPTAGCTDLMVRGAEAPHRMDRVLDLLAIPELRGIRRGRRRDSRSAPPTTFSRDPAIAGRPRRLPGPRRGRAVDRRLADPEPRHARRATSPTPARRATRCRCSSRWTRPSCVAGAGGTARDPLRRVPHAATARRRSQPGEIVARVRLPRAPPGTVQALPQGRDARGAGDQQGGRGAWRRGSRTAGSPTSAWPPAASRRRRSACAPPKTRPRQAPGRRGRGARRPRRRPERSRRSTTSARPPTTAASRWSGWCGGWCWS